MYSGVGATILSGREMLCLPYAGFLCIYPTNDLPIRHLIDGKTSSKEGYTGPIGKLLSKILDKEVNPNFKALPDVPALTPLPGKITNSLCTGTCVCYKYCHAIRTGIL